jgi:hypothetical protein
MTTPTCTSHAFQAPTRVTSAGLKIKSANAAETDYRDFLNIPAKATNMTRKENSIRQAIRYFEQKQHPSFSPVHHGKITLRNTSSTEHAAGERQSQ